MTGGESRKIETHVARDEDGNPVCPLNSQIKILAIGEPGAGGANADYLLHCESAGFFALLEFHHGDPRSGVTGWSNEAYLAVVLDRLEGFQNGPFACEENAAAREHVQKALEILKDRTVARASRGVAGTLQK